MMRIGGARRRRIASRWAAIAAVLGAALAGCSTTSGASSRPRAEPSVLLDGQAHSGSALASATSALCSVAATARKDEKSAYDEFLNHSHSDLHVIAGATQSKDRQVAAHMLVAMEALESTFESGGPPSRAATQARTLIERTNAALDVLHIDPVRCP